MIKLKYVSRLTLFICFVVAAAIRFLIISPKFNDFVFIFDLIVVILIIFPIPIYFFFKYKTFRLHTKTNKYLFGNSKESTFYFLFMYYFVYSFTILAIVFVIVAELAAGPDLPFSTIILATSLIYAILSSLFFVIMHRLAIKPNSNKNKKSEGAL
jgi:hypothetical protein